MTLYLYLIQYELLVYSRLLVKFICRLAKKAVLTHTDVLKYTTVLILPSTLHMELFSN